MTNLKLQMSKLIESGSLTAVVQTLANAGLQSYVPRSSFPCLGVTTLKDSALVFIESGVYAEMPEMLQTLEDLAAQPSTSARK